MAEQLNIKITLADGTEQVFIAPKGNAYITKAIPKAKYQLIDPTTKRAPEVVKAKRVGKNLHIEVMEGEQPAFEIVLEAYADAEGALVTGQAADGMLYEYSAQVSDTVQPVSALAEGQGYWAGLGRFPVAESLEGVVALAPAVGLAPGAVAAIAGAGAALAGGGGGGGGGAGSPSPNAVPAGGADVWKIIETAANSTRDGALKPTAEQYITIGVKGLDTAAELAMLGDIIDAQAWADVNTTAKVQALADAVAAVMTGAAGGTAPTLVQLQQMGMRGLTPDKLVALQRAIEQTPDDGSALNTVGKLQALLNTINEATSAISAAAQANNATELIPSAAYYVNAGVSGVDAANLAAINSALDTDKIDGAATNTPAGIQAVVDAYQAIFNAADGQKDADAKPTAQQYAAIGVTGLDASTPLTQLSLLGELIDGKSKADVDSVREVQDLADAVAAVMRGAAGGTPPTLDQLQKLGLTGLNPASLPALQKLIEQTSNDGTGVDTLSDLQKLLDDANKTLAAPSGTGAALISGYAEANSATETTPAASVYRDAGVTGVSDGTGGNLASINSALNTLAVDRDAANTPSEIQTIVNAYQAILDAADGRRDGDAKPTAAQYAAIGVTGMGGNVPVAKLNLLGDVIDGKSRADVDSAREVQDLADAVAAVMTGAAGGTAPTLEQLKKLGITGLTPANLAQVQDAIKQTADDGSGVETVAKLQNLVSAFNNAVDVISAAAQANSATETKPGISDYAAAGVSGVDASNLAAVNSALNSTAVDAAATDTRAEIQTLVDAYQAILNAADGQRDGDTKPTAQQYASIGVTGLTAGTPLVQLALLGDVIDGKAKADVDSVREVQELADAVAAVMKGAAGGTAPTLDELSKLGLTGLSPAALSELQKLIEQTPNDGTGVDTVKKLQDLVTQANAKLPVPTGAGTTLISGYAEANSATETTPALSAYTAAGVTGVSEGSSGNLASINSALNTAGVNGAAVNTAAQIQAVVNSYRAILDAANGVDDKTTATNPSAADYKNIGVSGFEAPTDAATIAKASLLGDAIDLKVRADVDTVPEIQELADAAAAVIAGAGTGPAPTLDDLQKLGLTGVTPANLAQVQEAIKQTSDDGSGVNTLGKLQNLINPINNALDVISAAAQANNATESTPSPADYTNAGVSGVALANLASVNSALNTLSIDGAAADTTSEIQALVDGYQAILNAADGSRDSDPKPTAQQYAAIGVAGVDTPTELGLLGDVIDAKGKNDVDSMREVQDLADAVAAVMKGAAGGTPPTLEQLQKLGLTGVSPDNLKKVQDLIAGTDDDGTGVDTLDDLQALINTVNTSTNVISTAAQDNSASEAKPAEGDYFAAGVKGVTAANLAAINSALNSNTVDGEATNTTAEIQTVVNSYQAILDAANGIDDKTTATNPSATDYKNIGVTGVDGATAAAKASLLGDAIDIKNKADVDTVREVQDLADAVAAVVTGAAGGTAPTLDQLQKLGLTGVNPANLEQIRKAITETPDEGTGVNTLDKIQALVDNINEAIGAISAAAQANNAREDTPSAADYINAGVIGVDAGNLAAINSALNTAGVDGAAVDTLDEIQAVVNAYQAILTAADGQRDADAKPTAQQYIEIGITGLDASNSATQTSLLGDVIDAKAKGDVDTVPEVQALADAVAAVMKGAAGGTAPTLEQLQELGLTGVNPGNLKKVQDAIAGTADDGTGVDTVGELQKLIDPLVPTPIVDTAATTPAQALSAIKDAAENNSATETSPDAATYGKAGASGVTSANLASINSALNTASVNGAAVDTLGEIQDIVNSYQAILNAANGIDDKTTATNPGATDYKNIGVSGFDAPTDAATIAKASLLGDAIDLKAKADVDTVPEIQELANAAAAVIAGAGTGPAPTLDDLQKLGITGVNPGNIDQIAKVIKDSTDDGKGVDSLDKIQGLVDKVNSGLDAISAAAQSNSATETSPTAADYINAGVSGVDVGNLAAINSALNTVSVDGQAVDTTGEIQAVVDAYQAILNAADGTKDSDAKPTAQQYAAIGVVGMDTPSELGLLGDVIDAKGKADVDTVPEVQALADAVAAVMKGAAGGTAPTLEQLQELGLTGVNPGNLKKVQDAIAGTADDGTGVDTVGELQKLIDPLVPTPIVDTAATTPAQALSAIKDAAENNSATETSPDAATYGKAGASGVTSANLASINSALNTASVNGAAVDTLGEIQDIVNSYQAILGAANGIDDKTTATNPSAADYKNIGVSGFDSASTPAATLTAKASLLGDAIDLKAKADVDTVPEIQELANAAAAVIAGAGTGPAPTLDDLQKLGITGVNPGNIDQIAKVIKDTTDDGKGVNTLDEIQALVDKVNSGLDAIKVAAQSNSATETSPTAADYINAGVSGVDAGNLAAINSALNTASVDGQAVDTTGEIQAVVDAYQAILNAADGTKDADPKPTAQQYAAIGVVGMDTPAELSLLGEVIDAKAKGDVDTVPEVQALADAVAAVMKGAAGGTAPTLEQLQELGLTGVNPGNLKKVQDAIAGTADDGTGVDTVGELQKLIDPLVPTPIVDTAATTPAQALSAIKDAAENNSATETSPDAATYGKAGASGVTSANLASINSALNTASVNGAAVDTLGEIQDIVNSYQAILGAANGIDDKTTATNPGATDYKNIGVSGFDAPTDAATIAKASLLGDAIDLKAKADVDTVPEIQELANAAAAVIAAAGTGPAPTIDDLQKLGITGVNPGNIDQIAKVIKDSTDDGKGVDSLDKIQGLVDKVNSGLDAISAAAQSNSATETSPTAADYINAGVSGVDAGNLASINSALNTASVDGAAVDTTGEIQAVVDAYQAILNAADGTKDSDAKPTAQQYAAIGVVGMDTPSELSLLGDVIDAKGKADVDTVPEVQALADAVAAVMKGAAGGTAPTLEQLQELGLTGVNPAALPELQKLIEKTTDDGSAVDTVKEIQDLLNSANALLPTPTGTGVTLISAYAEANSATETTPALSAYTAAGVTGVSDGSTGNLASINSALNTKPVDGDATNTTAEIQTVVNSYQAILNAANGIDDKTTATNPGATDYKNIGVSGFDAPTDAATIAKASLLGDAIDLKNKADVDTVPEIQELANAAAAVIAAAGTGAAPTIDDLQKLGVTGVNPGNIEQIGKLIKDSTDDGKGVDTLRELQALVPGSDITAPTATLAAGTSPNTGSAVAQSSEPGTAFLVKTGGTGAVVVTELANIQAAGDTKWNSVPISKAGTDTPLPLTGLEDGTYSLYTVDAAGNLSAAAAKTYTVDGTPPAAPALSLGTGVADGATAAEAAQTSGAVQVTAESGAAVTVTFTNGSKSVTKPLTGTGAAQPVVLSPQDLATLGDGTITVSATQTDAAGNTQTAAPATASFTLDTDAPAATLLTTGSGANTGSVQVKSDEPGTAYLIKSDLVSGTPSTLSDLANILTPSLDVNWNSVALSAADSNTNLPLTGLADGSYSLYTADAAGNLSPAASGSYNVGFVDTTPPSAPTLALGTGVTTGTDGATSAEATQTTGVVKVNAENGAAVSVTFTNGANSVTKPLTGTGSAQAVALSAQDLSTLGNGTITVSATQTDASGNAQTAAASTTSFLLDTNPPSAPTLALGTGVTTGADGATGAEATQTTGVVKVNAENGAAVSVTFTNGANSVTKPLTGTGSEQAVVLSAQDLSTLGNGTITVSATQTDASGNAQTAAASTTSFLLDTNPPSAPTLALGTGVTTGTDGATSAEATQTTGVVKVTAESGAAVSVTFTNGANSVTKPLTGTGSAQAVVLTAQDLSTLGNGTITVSATQTDASGNAQTATASTTSFLLDTNPPSAPTLALGTGVTTGTDGATSAEATQTEGVIRVSAESGAAVSVTFTNGANSVTKPLTGTGSAQAVVLTAQDLSDLGNGTITVTATQTDASGNAQTAAASTTSFLLDTNPPAAPTLALGTGVTTGTDGATSAEATQTNGVIRVSAESGAAVAVTFTNGANSVTKPLTGSGSEQAVVLSAQDLSDLGNGTITVTATQTDASGNAQTAAASTTSFLLDTNPLAAPTLALGAGVTTGADGATSAEATQTAGVIRVSAESGAAVAVTFTNGANSVTKPLTGTGSAQAVVLTAQDLSTLGNGTITVSATQTDASGNAQTATASTTSFLLDTNPPSAPTLALGTGVTTGTDGATSAEATQTTGVVKVTAESGAAVSVTFTNGANSVTKPLTGTGSEQAVVLSAQDLSTLGDGTITVSATQTDASGNAQTEAASTTSFLLDTNPPSATLQTTGTGPNSGNVAVRSSEPGTAYLVKTGGTGAVTVSDLASITAADGAKWNSLAIADADANNDVTLSLSGLEDGIYSLYTTDASGNLSPVATGSYTVGAAADTTSPTASLTSGSGRSAAGSATVQSSETGTAYLVKTGLVTGTPTTLADISGVLTSSNDSKWNSVGITAANANTSLALTGLEAGTYQLYTVDDAGNLSAASNTTFSVDNTAPKLTSMGIDASTVPTTSGNSKVIDQGDKIIFVLTMSEDVVVTPSSGSTISGFTLGFSMTVPADGSSYQAGALGSEAYKASYWKAENNKLYFTYDVKSTDMDHNGITINSTSYQIANSGTTPNQNYQGLSLGNAVIKDAAGNQSGLGQTSGGITNGGDLYRPQITPTDANNNTYLVNAIDLGSSSGVSNGVLMYGTQVEGSWYYYLDRDKDGNSNNQADRITYSVASGLNGLTTTEGLKLILPSVGSKTAPQAQNYSGTSINTPSVDNPDYNDLLAIWDAFNGSSSTAAAGVPQGWAPSRYWSSDAASPSSHFIVWFSPSPGSVASWPDTDTRGAFATYKVVEAVLP